MADAGINQIHCGPIEPSVTYTVTMAGNTPSIGTGLWTKFSGPAGEIITTPASPNTTISGLTAGAYVFTWTITNGTCSSSSNVDVNIVQCGPITVNESINVCIDNTGTGNILSGDSSPINALPLTSSTTPVVNVNHGIFSILANGNFTYTPGSGYTGSDLAVVSVCDNLGSCTKDTIFISVVGGVIAEAGPDQQLCEESTTTLTGNYPPAGSVGNWTFVSGPNVVNPSPSNTPAATVIGLIPSATPYVFKYTVTSSSPGASCSSFDTVKVTDFFYPSLPYPGSDQHYV